MRHTKISVNNYLETIQHNYYTWTRHYKQAEEFEKAFDNILQNVSFSQWYFYLSVRKFVIAGTKENGENWYIMNKNQFTVTVTVPV